MGWRPWGSIRRREGFSKRSWDCDDEQNEHCEVVCPILLRLGSTEIGSRF